jgi:hypothetical protein
LETELVKRSKSKGIQFRPLSRGVKKNGEKFREETSTVQPERSGGRLLVLGIFRHFLASGIKPAAFLFGSVSLSAVRKRNEHVQQRSRRHSAAQHSVRILQFPIPLAGIKTRTRLWRRPRHFPVPAHHRFREHGLQLLD